jgi:hypothetical protein
MARFDEQTPIADGIKEVAAMLSVMAVGYWLVSWAGPITDSALVSGVLGFATGALMIFVQRRFFASESDSGVNHGDAPFAIGRLIGVSKWVLIAGIAGVLTCQSARKAVDGVSYEEANMYGFWVAIVGSALYVWLGEKSTFSRQVSQ